MSRASRKRSASEPSTDLFVEESAAPLLRPSTIVVGAILLAARSIGAVIWALSILAQHDNYKKEFDLTSSESALMVGFLMGVSIFWALFLLLFAWLVLHRSNFARMLVMCGTAISIISAAIGYFSGDEEITVRTTLLTLALDILILLALSSRDARTWSRRRKR